MKDKPGWEARATKHEDLEELYRSGCPSGVANRGGVQLARTRTSCHTAFSAAACRLNIEPVKETFNTRVRAPSGLGLAHMARKFGDAPRLRRSTAVILVRAGKLETITFPEFNPLFSLRVSLQ